MIAPKIRRLLKDEFNKLNVKDLGPVEFCHFEGQKKPVPPDIRVHQGLPFTLLQQLHEHISSAVNLDVAWLVHVINTTNDDSPQAEWSGYMANVAKTKFLEPSVATNFLFGPLISAPPANPDTVLTTMLYIEKFIEQNSSTTNIHVCADMQLYKIVNANKVVKSRKMEAPNSTAWRDAHSYVLHWLHR